ncbi:MAG: thioredoxin fold domain-containing protein [Phycisphaerales bacterium]|nr:thioredoxin fold domain-containing protein [Phycisphaerales bacterium]
MKNVTITLAAVLVLMVTSSVVQAAGDQWVTDFEAAKASAKAGGKYLLVDFTGSDWCGWCVKLKKEVFDQDHFKKEAPKNFILVELDFPKRTKLDPKLTAQNRKLSQEYGVRGFPTILLMDADGKVFGKTGYQAGGPEKYIVHLKEMVEAKKAFDKLIAQADKAKGIEKAKLLDKALGSAPAVVRKSRTDLAEIIIELDKDDKAGLKTKYAAQAAMDELDTLRPPRTRDQAVIKEFAAKALAKVAEIEKKYPMKGAAKQKLLSQKAMYTFYSSDLAGAKKLLEEAIAIDPKSAMAKSMQRSLAFVTSRLEAEKKKSE